MALPMAASLFFVTSVMGQLVTPSKAENVAPAIKGKVLLRKVMTDLPRYEDAPVAVVAPQPVAEETTAIVHLVPFVIVGEKKSKLSEPQLLTKKAFAAEVLKQYDHAAFSLFQHREDVRLQDMATLRNYADNLLLAGDVEGSREIKKESNRLFLHPHDPESEYIDSLLNARIR
jgi:hypothetical protein